MKRTLAGILTVAAAVAGGCNSNKNPNATAANRAPLRPAVTEIAPTPPAPLYVASAQPVVATAAAAAQPVQYAEPAAAAVGGSNGASGMAGGAYTVKRGDTLYSIARQRYGDGKQWQRIASANPGLSPQSLKVGQKISIP